MDERFVPTELTASREDIDGITQACLDYVEGWYNADPERMRRCLHPDLVKRTVRRDPQTGARILGRPLDAERMVSYTQAGGGSQVPRPERIHQVILLDVFRHIACAKVISPEYMDYVQLARFDERWLIVNVLWALRAGEIEPDP